MREHVKHIVMMSAGLRLDNRAWRYTFARGTMADVTHSASPTLGKPDWLLSLVMAPVHLLRALIDGQLAVAGL